MLSIFRQRRLYQKMQIKLVLPIYSDAIERFTLLLRINGETSARSSRRGVRLDVRACCPSVFNIDILKMSMDVASCSAPAACPWMQLHAPLRQVLRVYCLPVDAASCTASPRAPRLLPVHGCNFVLHACYHAHG
jgi:hypothetical protein